jgi:hypothetical protein
MVSRLLHSEVGRAACPFIHHSEVEPHWSLDVTYREDESRIRERRLRENFAWLNRMTLSLLKRHPGRQSVAMKRRRCGWSESFLMEVITGSTH